MIKISEKESESFWKEKGMADSAKQLEEVAKNGMAKLQGNN